MPDPEASASSKFSFLNTPKALKVLGVLCILGGVVLTPNAVLNIVSVVNAFVTGTFEEASAETKALYFVLVCLVFLIFASYIILGIRLLRNKRRSARLISEITIILLIAGLLCHLMLYGLTPGIVSYIVSATVLIALLTYIDPTLSEERELQRRLRDMELREDAEDGTLGLDESGKGYIRLDFFNLFWIFVIACVLGDIIETIYHVAVVDPGVFQNRTGMLWGPFSPIYGFGAVLMTLALNRFHKANIWIIFLVSAVIGGAFEYFVSWFLQFAFGVVAWDYTGTFLNIGGRTNFMFMCMWGVLGVFWIKGILPGMLKLVNMIPWKWRYTVTAVAAAFMLADGFMTLFALDCWYSRLAGAEPDNALAWFCAEHYDNEWMANHFQSMSIDPSMSTRA